MPQPIQRQKWGTALLWRNLLKICMHHGVEIGYGESGLVAEWEGSSNVCHPYEGRQKSFCITEVGILFCKHIAEQVNTIHVRCLLKHAKNTACLIS